MPTRIELQQIAERRLEEAKALVAAKLYDGARYLAGYVVETALKVCICKLLDEDYPPPGRELARTYKTHDFDDLVVLAGLRKRLAARQAADSNNQDFQTNWKLVQTWKEIVRYEPINSTTAEAVSELITALDDPQHGIFTWIKTQW